VAEARRPELALAEALPAQVLVLVVHHLLHPVLGVQDLDAVRDCGRPGILEARPVEIRNWL
jgi:hypothetical protein